MALIIIKIFCVNKNSNTKENSLVASDNLPLICGIMYKQKNNNE